MSRHGCGTEQPLVAATLVALRRALAIEIAPVRIAVMTSIPRNVGLGGSSAIVLATARALIDRHRASSWAQSLAREPERLASVALEAETSVLGIRAGPQDRLVQALDANVFMDFADWSPGPSGGSARWSAVGDLPGAWFVACRSDRPSESGAVHVATMDGSGIAASGAELAALARAAAAAIASRDVRALGDAMLATYDIRARHMTLDPTHVAMVERVRASGAFANYTGSGGAVIVLAATPPERDRLARSLHDELGCEILALGG